MGLDDTLLGEIVRRVLSVARPDTIILFGSAATGQMTKDSDIDLLIVEPSPDNTHERSVQIRRVRTYGSRQFGARKSCHLRPKGSVEN